MKRGAHQNPRGARHAFAAVVNPLVDHPRRTDLHRPRPASYCSRLPTAVADDQTPALCVACIGVRRDVVHDLFVQGRRQHAPRALSGHLILGAHGDLGRLGVVFALLVEYRQRRVVSPSPRTASQGVLMFTSKDTPPVSRPRSTTFGYTTRRDPRRQDRRAAYARGDRGQHREVAGRVDANRRTHLVQPAQLRLARRRTRLVSSRPIPVRVARIR